MNHRFYFLFLLSLLSHPSLAQVGIGGDPQASAALDVKATDKAFYPPRLTTDQRNAIVKPQPGALVYDLNQNTLFLYDGTNWLPMAFQNITSIMPTIRPLTPVVAGVPASSVAISGDFAFVGLKGDNPRGGISGQNQGQVQIFSRPTGSWMLETGRADLQISQDEQFGSSVAAQNNFFIIGAPGYNKTGVAYIYVNDSEDPFQTITDPKGASGDQFGSCVAISNLYAITGGINSTSGNGAVYIFTRPTGNSTFTQQQQLIPQNNDNAFGNSAAISGEYAIVGTKNRPGESKAGTAFIFTHSGPTWTQQQLLTASDGTNTDLFGTNVAISGDYAIIGAPGKTIGSNASQGAAYIFTRSGTSWTQQRLTVSDGATGDLFGSSVAISGDYAIIGAPGKTIGSNASQGAAYIFTRSGGTWTQQRLITVPFGTANAKFGSTVGIDDDSYIIGSALSNIAFGSLKY